jgi:perosamine synthetase
LKRQLFQPYSDAFRGSNGAKIVKEPPESVSSDGLQTIILKQEKAMQRGAILLVTNDSGVMTRSTFTLLHKLPACVDCPRGPLPISESLKILVLDVLRNGGFA